MRTVREIEAIALKARKRLGLLQGGFHEPQLRKRLEDSGFFLFYYPFGESGISGAVYNSGEVKVLVINSSKSMSWSSSSRISTRARIPSSGRLVL